jgi:hypothetical protein
LAEVGEGGIFERGVVVAVVLRWIIVVLHCGVGILGSLVRRFEWVFCGAWLVVGWERVVILGGRVGQHVCGVYPVLCLMFWLRYALSYTIGHDLIG